MARTVKINKDLQPGQPEKPKHLSEDASVEWDRLVGELERSGIRLTPAHRTRFYFCFVFVALLEALTNRSRNQLFCFAPCAKRRFQT